MAKLTTDPRCYNWKIQLRFCWHIYFWSCC